ncbi:MAG: hypothetical protein ING62_16495 [Rhodocyclaceae bacterium]|nr:hypothetical protein [Rhodocyclaceae bacterium]
MGRLDGIKKELERGADPDLLPDCLRILELMDRSPDDQLEMLSWSALAKATGREAPDGALIAAVAYLVNSPAHVLEPKGLFIDENDEEYVLTQEVIHAAIEGGIFAHPETGKLVSDFAKHVFPFFHASDRFKQLKVAE